MNSMVYSDIVHCREGVLCYHQCREMGLHSTLLQLTPGFTRLQSNHIFPDQVKNLAAHGRSNPELRLGTTLPAFPPYTSIHLDMLDGIGGPNSEVAAGESESILIMHPLRTITHFSKLWSTKKRTRPGKPKCALRYGTLEQNSIMRREPNVM